MGVRVALLAVAVQLCTATANAQGIISDARDIRALYSLLQDAESQDELQISSEQVEQLTHLMEQVKDRFRRNNLVSVQTLDAMAEQQMETILTPEQFNAYSQHVIISRFGSALSALMSPSVTPYLGLSQQELSKLQDAIHKERVSIGAFLTSQRKIELKRLAQSLLEKERDRLRDLLGVEWVANPQMRQFPSTSSVPSPREAFSVNQFTMMAHDGRFLETLGLRPEELSSIKDLAKTMKVTRRKRILANIFNMEDLDTQIEQKLRAMLNEEQLIAWCRYFAQSQLERGFANFFGFPDYKKYLGILQGLDEQSLTEIDQRIASELERQLELSASRAITVLSPEAKEKLAHLVDLSDTIVDAANPNN